MVSSVPHRGSTFISARRGVPNTGSRTFFPAVGVPGGRAGRYWDRGRAAMTRDVDDTEARLGRAAVRAETRLRVQEALNGMDPLDREVLVLRHFELLSNEETARVLGIKPSAASNRHVRALRRLEEILSQTPGLAENAIGL